MYSNSAVTAAGTSGLELFAMFLPLLLMLFVILILIAWCKLFRKAGLPWERMFVPVYSSYWMYKIAGAKKIFWTNLIISIVMMLSSAIILPFMNSADSAVVVVSLLCLALVVTVLVLYCVYCVKLSKAFGHGGGFAFGLIVLYPIFIMILGFGSSEYVIELPE